MAVAGYFLAQAAAWGFLPRAERRVMWPRETPSWLTMSFVVAGLVLGVILVLGAKRFLVLDPAEEEDEEASTEASAEDVARG